MRPRSRVWLGLAFLSIGVSACDEPPPASTGVGEALHAVAGIDEGPCARLHASRLTPIGSADQSSPIVLGELSGKPVAIVADEDENAIFTIDRKSGAVLSAVETTSAPGHLMMTLDGRIAVTFPTSSELGIYEPGPTDEAGMERRCTVSLAAEPRHMAWLPKRTALLVSSGWGRMLTKVDVPTASIAWAHKVAAEPRGIAVSDDGQRAFVGHAIGGMVTAVELRQPDRSKPIPIGIRSGAHKGSIERTANQGYALTALSVPGAAPGAPTERLFAPHASVHAGQEKRPSSSGYSNFGEQAVRMSVAVIEPGGAFVPMLSSLSKRPRSFFVSRAESCALPRAIVGTGHRLWVACLDGDAVLELDARAADPAGLELHRTQVPSGPMGLALDPERAQIVVWSQFARELTTIAVDDDAVKLQTPVRLPVRESPRVDPLFARGRQLFHSSQDPRLSTTGQACASCHPDGRQDALVWPSPDGPRQTVHLSGRIADTAPYGWFGEHDSLEDHIEQTVQRLRGAGFDGDEPKEDLRALAHFVTHMAPPPVRTESDLVARGRELFESAEQGCAGCHPDGGTNRVSFDVGSGSPEERRRTFDTPTLAFVGGTAPYFHDGRYATLDSLLLETSGQMGHAEYLHPSDRHALIAYLEWL